MDKYIFVIYGVLIMSMSQMAMAQSPLPIIQRESIPKQNNLEEYSTISAVWFCNGKFFDDSFGQMICKIQDKISDTIPFHYIAGQMYFKKTDLVSLLKLEEGIKGNGQRLNDEDCFINIIIQIHSYAITWDKRTISVPIPYSQIGPFMDMESDRLQFFVTMMDDSYFVYIRSSDGFKYFHTTLKGKKAQKMERRIRKEHYRQYNLENGLLGRMW